MGGGGGGDDRGLLLETGFDGVDGCVGQGAHGARDQTDAHGLVRGEFALVVVVGWLGVLEETLELAVGGEVDFVGVSFCQNTPKQRISKTRRGFGKITSLIRTLA